MDVLMAAFRLVHEAPCGTDRLAQAVGKSVTTLNHEVSLTYDSAKLGLRDAVTLSMFTGDRQILDAFALQMDCMVVALPPPVPGLEGIATKTAALAREFGELMAEVTTSAADGAISPNELARTEREASQMVTALTQLICEVRSMAGRPAA
jgi:hypothetical protein